MPLESALSVVEMYRDGYEQPEEGEVPARGNERRTPSQPREKSEAEIVAQNNAALKALEKQMGMSFG